LAVAVNTLKNGAIGNKCEYWKLVVC